MNTTPEIRQLNGKTVRFYSPSQLEEIRQQALYANPPRESRKGLHPLASNGITYSSGRMTEIFPKNIH